jgi:hypothetical protein
MSHCNRVRSYLLALAICAGVARADVFVFDDSTGTPSLSQSPDTGGGSLYDSVTVVESDTCVANPFQVVTITPTDGLGPDNLIGVIFFGDAGTNQVNYEVYFNSAPYTQLDRPFCDSSLTIAQWGTWSGLPLYPPYNGCCNWTTAVQTPISDWPFYPGPTLVSISVLPTPSYRIGIYHEPFTCPPTVCTIISETSGVQTVVTGGPTSGAGAPNIHWRSLGGAVWNSLNGWGSIIENTWLNLPVVRSDTWYFIPQ